VSIPKIKRTVHYHKAAKMSVKIHADSPVYFGQGVTALNPAHRSVERKQVNAHDGAMNLESLTDAALLEMVGGRGKVVRAEVLRRVVALRNTVNLLAFRYLWPLNATDKDDAWSGLVACCWRAKGNLFLWEHGDRLGTTQKFIEDALRARLSSYRKLDKQVIARIALNAEFRWTARLVRNALADHVRKMLRGRTRRGRPSKPRVAPGDARTFLQTLLQVQRERFVAALGDQWCCLLSVLAGAVPLGATKRQWKSAVTRLIATHRGVSQQQARADKRTMLSLAEGEPVIEGAVQEILCGAFVSRENSPNRYMYRETEIRSPLPGSSP
jgi:hypothetical protein